MSRRFRHRSEYGVAVAGKKPTWDFNTRTKTVDGLTFSLTKADLMKGMAMPLTVKVTELVVVLVKYKAVYQPPPKAICGRIFVGGPPPVVEVTV